MEKFKQLGLHEGILQAIKAKGFSEPSEIQEKTIPLVIAGRDVIGSSATGSGKTLAFGAGIIDRMKRGAGLQTLILTPTRELAEQVASTLRMYSHSQGLNVKEIYGGVSMGPQVRELRFADIVVGTPGRILDHLSQRTINLRGVKYLILDEADRMLDMGFIRDVEKIIQACPKERQTLLFSATMSKEIEHIAQRHMKNPALVEVDNKIDPALLYQKYYDVSSEQKFSLLTHLLRLEKNGVVMVFCNTRRNVDKLSDALKHQGIHSMAIHGGLSQNRRSDTLQAFHARETLILICTDVAARGLDIKDVSHVYNFDLPNSGTDYIHRIGRTARAGKNGIAISFVSSGDHSEFRQICRDISLEIEKEALPVFSVIPVNFSSNADRKQARQGRHGGNQSRFHRKSYGSGRGGRGGRNDSRGRGESRDGGRREGFRGRFQRGGHRRFSR